MHTDVERLIAMAKSTGFITPRQREMILSKARALGDDIVEVEFYLDDIPIKEEPAPSNNTQSYARPNPAYSAQPKPNQQTSAAQEKPKKKKKGKWIWIMLLVIVVIIGIIAVASAISDSSSVSNMNNYYNYTDWDNELTRFNNGWDSYFGELAMGRPMNEVDNDYIWLNVLNNNIENAYYTGQLTPEQQNRYAQIMNKVENQAATYAIGAGAMYLLNQIFTNK